MASGRQTDEDLMAAVAHGSRAALRELYGRYERPLYQFVFRHGGGRDAEDLCQEAWLRVVRSARRFDRTRRFSTWLFQITINLCRDWHRRPPPDPVDATRTSWSPAMALRRSLRPKRRSMRAVCSRLSPKLSAARFSCATTTAS